MAKKNSSIKYEFLDNSKNFIYDARETGKTHSSFKYELNLFKAIKNGDVEGVKNALEFYKKSGIIIGRMSNNISNEIHYFSVSSIAVAIHYAILGGLDESEAYKLSDKYIQEIDAISSMEDSINYLSLKAIELANKVREDTIPKIYSKLINECIHLIHINLHSRLKIEDIAKTLHISRDYLSQAFKKETGIPLHKYILKQKLEESISMMNDGKAIGEVSYILGFSSESHFIQCFKKVYKQTPCKYMRNNNPDNLK